MTTLIAMILGVTFSLLSALHFYWGLGGRWASSAVLPTKDDNTKVKMPGIFPTSMVALGLLGFGFFILIKGGLVNFKIPGWLSDYGLPIIAAIFIFRAIGEFSYIGFFKKHKLTKFAYYDTRYYSPLCLLIGILALILAFNS